MARKKINVKNVVWKEGKHYVAQSLNVDVSSFGKTRVEAIDNLIEALRLYFESAKVLRISKIEHPKIVTASL